MVVGRGVDRVWPPIDSICTPIESQQVKALHLDVDFLKFDKASVQGILPELWGLAPISGDTKQVLSPQ